MKKALVITYSPLDFDSRVRRQVEALADDFHVTVCHPEKSQRYPWEQVSLHWKAAVRESTGKEPGLVLRVWATISFLVRNVLLVLGLYGIAEKVPYTPYFVGYQSLRKTVPEKYELVVANDAETLPLAFALARGAAVVADLHEFAPGETAGKTLRHRTRNRQMAWICRKHLPNCSAVTVVSQAVSDLYFDHFQIPCSVLPSMPEFARIKPSAINPSNIKLVHHGIYSPNRGIELLIRAVAQLPPHFSLHLVLGGAPVVDLLNLGRSLGLQSGRLKLHDFVEPDALIVFLNQFDVEVVFVPPFAPNARAGLPNKFFEAIQARLAVVSGPTHEITSRIDKYGIGRSVESFEVSDLAETLSSITVENVKSWKRASNAAASKLNWESIKPNYSSFV